MFPEKKPVREYPCRTHLGASVPPGQSETPLSTDMKHRGDNNNGECLLSPVKMFWNSLDMLFYLILTSTLQS